jgi:hypothetical protein
MIDTIINALSLNKYFGLDIAAATFMFLSMYRLGHHKKDGFALGALASLCWIAFNILADSPAGVVANAVIAAMALRSLLLWHKPNAPVPTPTTTAPQEPR